MRKIAFYLVFSIVLLSCPSAYGQVTDKKELEAKIDVLVPKSVSETSPGLVVGVVQKGELVFSKGYGLANISYGIANDPKMVYNIGSVSKQFLGYAFAMLHKEGKLDLDDPVTKYLEDWPEFEHKVTLRHLLTHTSGYREAYTMSNLAGRMVGVDRLTREECLDVVRKQPQLEFVPGTRWVYNSTAWVILAEVLEKVTGYPADEWVENNILKPLGMNTTQIESHVGEVMMNAAESYTYSKEQGYTNHESNRAIFGAAEVYSSIEDLAKWISNYHTAEVGGKAASELFLAPYVLADGSNSGYALGIGNSTYRGLKRYRHTGGHEAFITQLSYYPEHELGIIVISNYGGKGNLPSSKIAEFILGDYISIKVAPKEQTVKLKKKDLEAFEGLYLATTYNRTVELKLSKGSLIWGGRSKLIPTSANTFRVEGWNGKITIDNGQLSIVDGTTDTYLKVEKWAPTQEELTVFEGDYWSKELETVYHLKVKDEKLSIQHRWLGEISLDPVSKDVFSTRWGFYVKFLRTKEGELMGLSISSPRTLNVVFDRVE